MEETGVKAGKLTLVGIYSDPSRDPRGHTVSGGVPHPRPRAQGHGRRRRRRRRRGSTSWQRLDLAFDHKKILRHAMRIATETLKADGPAAP